MRAAIISVLLVSAVASAWTAAGGNQTNLNQYWGSASLALFESLGTNGVGAREACPQPNWITQSEALDLWSTTIPDGGSVTANYAAGPSGEVTAERLVCPGGSTCRIFQAFSTPRSQTTKMRVMVKGTSDAGTVYISGLGSGGTLGCTYSPSTWTECATAETSATTSHFIEFGCEQGLYGHPANCPAMDVLLTRAQVSFTSTFGTYATTTTAVAGPPVTGSRGEAMTYTRGSVATCTKTRGSGTQAIADGDLSVAAINQPVIMPGDDGTATNGLLSEPSVTNVAKRSEELDNAAVYVPAASGGAAVPVVTANYLNQSPFDNPYYSYAERVQFPAVTTSQTSVLNQADICAVGQSCTPSVYVKAIGSDCTIDICSYTGGATNQCATWTARTTHWTRIYKGATAAGGTGYWTLGNCPSSSCSGGSSTNACDLLVTGAQAESNTLVPSSYIPTPGTTASRSASGPLRLASISLSVPWCIGADVVGTGSGLPFNQRGLVMYAAGEWKLDTGGPNQGSITRAGVGSAFSGTTTAPPARYSASRNAGGTTVTVCTNSSCTTGALSGSTSASGVLDIGVTNASNPYTSGIIKRVKVDRSETRCRQ